MGGRTINATGTVSTEALLQLVADPRRRQLLHHLSQNGDGATTFDELIEAVATNRGDSTARRRTDSRSLLVELQHNHLPKLAEAGVVEYDRRSSTVRYSADDRVEDLLQFVSKRPGERQ